MTRRRPRRSAAFRVAFSAVILTAFTASCSTDSESTNGSDSATKSDSSKWVYSGVVRTPIPNVADQSVPEADTLTPFSFAAPKDDLLVTYFGYTSCPDVCPTTLADLKAALKKVGNDAARVHVAMVTIDPRRDTAAILSPYLHSFLPKAVALRTDDPAVLASVTAAFAVKFTTDYTNPEDPKVSHSGSLYAINSKGQIVMAWPFGTTPSDLAGDLQHLISQNGTPTTS